MNGVSDVEHEESEDNLKAVSNVLQNVPAVLKSICLEVACAWAIGDKFCNTHQVELTKRSQS